MKKYPLEVKSVGADMYCVMSKGHHEVEAFMAEVKKEFPTWPMGAPEHCWMRCMPDASEEYDYVLVPAVAGSRGAFPVTWSNEHWSK